jgi:hypothetical protein
MRESARLEPLKGGNRKQGGFKCGTIVSRQREITRPGGDMERSVGWNAKNVGQPCRKGRLLKPKSRQHLPLHHLAVVPLRVCLALEDAPFVPRPLVALPSPPILRTFQNLRTPLSVFAPRHLSEARKPLFDKEPPPMVSSGLVGSRGLSSHRSSRPKDMWHKSSIGASRGRPVRS